MTQPTVPALSWPYYWQFEFKPDSVSFWIHKRPWFLPLRTGIESYGHGYVSYSERDYSGREPVDRDKSLEEIMAEIQTEAEEAYRLHSTKRAEYVANGVREHMKLPKGTKIMVKR